MAGSPQALPAHFRPFEPPDLVSLMSPHLLSPCFHAPHFLVCRAPFGAWDSGHLSSTSPCRLSSQNLPCLCLPARHRSRAQFLKYTWPGEGPGLPVPLSSPESDVSCSMSPLLTGEEAKVQCVGHGAQATAVEPGDLGGPQALASRTRLGQDPRSEMLPVETVLDREQGLGARALRGVAAGWVFCPCSGPWAPAGWGKWGPGTAAGVGTT